MIAILTALLTVGLPGPGPGRMTWTPQDSLRQLYQEGATFAAFLDATRTRTDQWHALYRDAQVDSAALARARAVSGTWHLLVIAEDWCQDSMNTVPYMARLAALVDGLDMRVLHAREGRSVMEAHRTPDGRPATPTVILLDDAWREVGAFVERPHALQDWVMAHRKTMASGEIHAHIFSWYAKDRGAGTVGDIVDLLEAATREPGCASVR